MKRRIPGKHGEDTLSLVDVGGGAKTDFSAVEWLDFNRKTTISKKVNRFPTRTMLMLTQD